MVNEGGIELSTFPQPSGGSLWDILVLNLPDDTPTIEVNEIDETD